MSSTVPILTIVIDLNIFKGDCLLLALWSRNTVENQLYLDRTEKGLGAGTVIGHTFPGHSGEDVVLL